MARTAFLTGPAHKRAIELLRAGLRSDAELEFEQMIEDADGSGWLLYRLSRELAEERLYELSAQAALRFVPLQADSPPDALAMAYPAVFPEIVIEQSSDNGFSPFLLLGLVRQESFYDPRAVSPADASGLTQVIPTTAEGIAEDLQREGLPEQRSVPPAREPAVRGVLPRGADRPVGGRYSGGAFGL